MEPFWYFFFFCLFVFLCTFSRFDFPRIPYPFYFCVLTFQSHRWKPFLPFSKFVWSALSMSIVMETSICDVILLPSLLMFFAIGLTMKLRISCLLHLRDFQSEWCRPWLRGGDVCEKDCERFEASSGIHNTNCSIHSSEWNDQLMLWFVTCFFSLSICFHVHWSRVAVKSW